MFSNCPQLLYRYQILLTMHFVTALLYYLFKEVECVLTNVTMLWGSPPHTHTIFLECVCVHMHTHVHVCRHRCMHVQVCVGFLYEKHKIYDVLHIGYEFPPTFLKTRCNTIRHLPTAYYIEFFSNVKRA